MLKGGPAEDDSAQGDGAGVFIDVEPVEDYAVRYDHAFNRGLWRLGPSPFRATWGPKKEKELREMRWRRKSGADVNEELLRIYEEEKLCDGFLADIDRPGPLPEVTQKIHRFLPVPKLHHFLRRRAKAMLILPLPGAGKGTSEVWKEVVDSNVRRRCRAEGARGPAPGPPRALRSGPPGRIGPPVGRGRRYGNAAARPAGRRPRTCRSAAGRCRARLVCAGVWWRAPLVPPRWRLPKPEVDLPLTTRPSFSPAVAAVKPKVPLCREAWMELGGFEPPTSWVRSRRSAS
jgi:hypothetical protein